MRATRNCSPRRPTRRRSCPSPIAATSSITTARKRAGSIVVDSDARYLYYVLPDDKNGRKKAIRYGIAVGEEALAFSGIAKVGRMAEWPSWTPTQNIKNRLEGIPNFVGPGPHNPLGARGLYLYANNKDTLFRIHGTNQPDMIGAAVSSGCIRMTNEDIIDLYNRTKMGAIVVVLAPEPGRLAEQSAGRARMSEPVRGH